MTLREASTRFLEHLKSKNSHDEPETEAQAHARTVEFLTSYLPAASLEELTPEVLRDFSARWYIEQTDHQPAPQAFLKSLVDFLRWAETCATLNAGCLPVILELQETMGRALEMSQVLSSQLRARGAFGFPEFLSSFEEGGRSQYDVDVGGGGGALEGFFRISRIEGTNVEAEDLISGEQVWPVSFPAESARLLKPGYILNLELVRAGGGWQIAACGFAYPPGTEF